MKSTAALDSVVSITPFEPQRDLLLASWIERKLPPRNYLLGNVVCTTSRWLLWGETGVGKTLFALEFAAAIAAGRSFLGWEGSGTPVIVMYLDGELPAETFKERMILVSRRYGSNVRLYGFSREVLSDGEMPPLNTPEGEAWLWYQIDAIKPDFIVFDSIMSLLVGTMSDEDSWAPMKPLVRKLSGRRIAQLWLHHTGHDTTKGFGTKTREWEMDTVASLTKANDDGEKIALEFRKARLRTPETKSQFEPCIIQCEENGWAEVGPLTTSKRRQGSEKQNVERAILETYDRLANDISQSPGFDGKPVRKAPVDKLRDEMKSRGYLDVDEQGHVTSTSRSHFREGKLALLSANTLIEAKGLIWRP